MPKIEGIMTQDYDIIIHVSHDRFGQRSAAVATSPEGMPAGEVNEVISQLKFNIDGNTEA